MAGQTGSGGPTRIPEARRLSPAELPTSSRQMQRATEEEMETDRESPPSSIMALSYIFILLSIWQKLSQTRLPPIGLNGGTMAAAAVGRMQTSVRLLDNTSQKDDLLLFIAGL